MISCQTRERIFNIGKVGHCNQQEKKKTIFFFCTHFAVRKTIKRHTVESDKKNKIIKSFIQQGMIIKNFLAKI